MIEMQYNFPLLPGQGEQWQQRLRTAVDALHVTDANELRPTFRSDHSAWRALAAQWIGSSPESTWITSGNHHGSLIALMAAGIAGKPVAVDQVTYAGILHQGRMLGCPLAAVAFDDQGMTAESLRAVCKTQKPAAIYTMPTVHNPLGCTAGLARREAIVHVARDFDLAIVQDDAYGYMDPDAPASYAELAPERTFYIRGLAKSYAPAALTGFLVAPARYEADIQSALMNTATGTSLVHNAAAMSLLADGSLQRVIDRKLAEGARRNAAARAVLGDSAAPGARSAWHLWITLPEGLDAPAAQRLCEERGVLVSGGQGFAVPGTTARGLRVALGGELDGARTQQGIEVVAAVLSAGAPLLAARATF